ncbi:hypothetical protein VTN77DRAFT_4922 [Rasamsonia byssochlamydoides]|uniref:uncharacterized protein n=1 Tax=Rasamsonia byssochlamydoides TaxID=89139 RepID=UPI0037433715
MAKKGKKNNKKGSKTANAPSESRPSPAALPTLDPQKQQVTMDPEPLPPISDSAYPVPEVTEVKLDQDGPQSPHQPNVENETGQGEVAEPAPSSPKLEASADPPMTPESPEIHISEGPENKDPLKETAEAIPEEPQQETVEPILEELQQEPVEAVFEEPQQETAGTVLEETQQEAADPAFEEPQQEAAKAIFEEPQQEAAEAVLEESYQDAVETVPEEPQQDTVEVIPEGPQETVQTVPEEPQETAEVVLGEPQQDTVKTVPEEPYQDAAEPVLEEPQKDTSTANEPRIPPAEPEAFSPEQPKQNTYKAHISNPSSPPPRRPQPAPIPLPSPSLTEARTAASRSPSRSPDHHRLPHPGSPVAYSSPVYKYTSPRVYPYSPYGMGMNGTGPDMLPPGSVPPSSGSYATAFCSPVMEHPHMGSPYGGYPKRVGSMGASGREYFPSPGGPSMMNGHHRIENENGLFDENGGHGGHEPFHLLSRIEKVMPDLTRLLHSYKEVQSKLSAKEAETRQLEAQHEQALMHKDFYIEALQSQMKKVAHENAQEVSELKNTINERRMELGNLQEKLKDLEENLEASEKENGELLQTKAKLGKEIEDLQAKIRDLQEAHKKELEEQKEHEKAALETQKEELTNLFEDIRSEDEKAANDKLEEREKELLDEQAAMKAAWEEEKRQMEEARASLQKELQAKIEELNATQADLETTRQERDTKISELELMKAVLESTQAELETTRQELDTKIGELESTQSELDATKAVLESTQAELESKVAELEDKQKELEETRQKHAEELKQLADSHRGELVSLDKSHASELSSLRESHEEELATMKKEAEERLQALATDIEEKARQWAADRADFERRLTEKSDELASLEREKEALERDDIAREKQLQSAVDEMRRTIDNMEHDREKLRRTLQSLGEATDLKTSKGDAFFLEAFGQLSRLIIDLSKEHFAYLPIDPPKDILEKIPPEIPSFLDNTPASRELRSAYVQHVISKTLTYRIFQPFLFTLGRRYDKADTFFQVLSLDIRRKSVRREAYWRQQTLKAAYTTSDAKQSINVVAAVIVDEIVDHIKHFADPKKLDALLAGVRRIVKLAAETWRHARVERELVLATMPAPESEGVSNDEWDEYTCGRQVENHAATDPARHVLLRLFPRIYREAAHEDFADDKEKINACIYSPGVVLFSNSPSVLARREELARKATESPTYSRSGGDY